MNAHAEADEIIRALGLVAHPEGGHFRETFRDPQTVGGRAVSTAIYFLLRESEVSRWHRIDAAETWHFYRGAPLLLRTSLSGRGGALKSQRLSANIAAGDEPQIVVPAGAWQSAKSLGAYSLVGCTVAPGFEFAKFELAPEGWEPR